MRAPARARRSAALPALLLAAAACGPGEAPALSMDDGGGDEAEAPEGGRPAPFHATFEDATEAAGLRFVHATGGRGEKLLPETMGSGACLFDHDGDGVLDLFLVNSGVWPHEPRADAVGEAPACALYRGNGDGTFTDVSAETGADLRLYGMGCAAADHDADGDQDLYVTALGRNVLLRNEGGRFTDATDEAGLAGGTWRDAEGREHPEWSTAAMWLDAEADGDLDLFVGNYCEWTPELEIFTTLDGVHKAFTTPDRYTGLPCRLWRNRGDGTFEETAFEGEGPRSIGKALGVAAWDIEGDGLCEVAVANDTRPNLFFENRGGGRFEERGARLGLAYDENGRARAGMGIDVADLGGTGEAAVAIGNFAGEPLSLYRWDGAVFRPAAGPAGLGEATFTPLAFGLAFLDADLDGCLDLVVVNGHIEPDIARFRAGERWAQPAQLFRGRGDGTFEDVSHLAGEDFRRPRVGRGLAVGDVDGDGDLDLVVTTNGGPAALLLNRQQETRPRHFLRVALEGPPGNPRGLGALVTLSAGGRTQRRLVRTGSSYLSQSEVTLTFGLGDAARVDSLEVRWPDGTTRRHAVAGVDRTVVLGRE